MSSSERLKDAEVRRLLRLVRELSELPLGTGEREEHLLRTLAELTGAPFAMLFHADGFTREHMPAKTLAVFQVGMEAKQLSLISEYAEGRSDDDPLHPGVVEGLDLLRPGELLTVRRHDLLSDGEWYRDDHVSDFRRAVDCDHCLLANLKLEGDTGRTTILAVHRPWGERAFGERAMRLLSLVWPEVAPLVAYRPNAVGGLRPDPVSGRSVAVRPLSPRLRQVLGALLRGLGNKEIARELGLSAHTVKDYVKELHRVFDVSSRTELIALCAGFLGGQ